MKAQERVEFRGVQYGCMRLDPLRGGRLAARVGQILAAAASDVQTVATLLKSYADAKPAAASGEKDANAAAAAIGAMLKSPELLASLAGGASKVDVDALYEIALQFARGNLFAGEHKLHDDHAFNAWFTQHPDHLLWVLGWVLRVNCAGFFGLAGKA